MEKLDKRNIEDVLALTPVQEGMLFHYLKNPGSDLYFEQLSLEISGEINIEIFKKAWDFVIETNEMLRTIFRWENLENPVQITLKQHHLQLKYHDIPGEIDKKKKKHIEKIKAGDRKETFDLQQEVPFKVTLCKIHEDRYEMIISNHHILYDGWSNGIILKEFFKAYDDLSRGRQPVKSAKTKFKEFVKWNREQDREKQEKPWKDYLKDIDKQTELTVKRRRKITTHISDTFKTSLSKDLTDKIENFVKSHKITCASLFYSTWGLLLQQYNCCNDILLDTTVSGRSTKLKGIEEAVGLFINTLPLRVQTRPHEKIIDFLSRTNDMLQGWTDLQDTTLMSIKEHLDEHRQDYLFQSVLVVENYPLDTLLLQENSVIKVNSFSISSANQYDITMIVTLFDVITIDFIYKKQLFDKEIIEELGDQFSCILKRIIECPGENVAALTIPLENVKKKILAGHTAAPSLPVIDHVGPGDRVEEKLLDLWEEIFRIDKGDISIDANFFDFGGHSLKAKVLAAKIHRELKVRVPLEKIFKLPTIRNMAKFIKGLNREHYEPVKAVEKKDHYQLSSAQERFYILHKMDEQGVTFNMINVYTLEGKLEKRKLENAFHKMSRRHEILRTSFHFNRGEPVQRVEDYVDFKVEYDTGRETGIKEEIEKFIQPFHLETPPLFRVKLIQVKEDKYYLLFDIHHILSDGISITIIMREFITLYREKRLAPLQVQYKSYAAWQKKILKDESLIKQEKYWMKKMDGFQYSYIPEEKSWNENKAGDYNPVPGKCKRQEIPPSLFHKIKDLCHKFQVTKFTFMISIFLIVLEMETCRQDITIGTPFVNRDHNDLNDLIGVFLNVLLIRWVINKNDTFMDYLAKMDKNLTEAVEHSSYPYELLVEKIRERNHWQRDELFTILFNYFVLEDHIHELNDELKMSHIDFPEIAPKYDMTLYVTETRDVIKMDLVFKGSRVSEYRSKRILDNLLHLTARVLENPELKLSQLNMMEYNYQVLGDLAPGVEELYENDDLI